MTDTFEQPAIDFPSAPIAGDTLATVKLVAEDWRADEDWRRFEAKCRAAAMIHGEVSPDVVRRYLTTERDGLTIAPRRLSAFYNRATSKAGFLDFSHWGINGDTKGRNAGRPARIYKIRTSP